MMTNPLLGSPSFSCIRAVKNPLFLLAILLSPAVNAEVCENPVRLRFSFVPQGNVRSTTEAFQPLIQHINKLVGKPVVIVPPSSYNSVIEGLLSGTIDFALLGPASYVAAKQADPGITAFASFSRISGAFDTSGSSYHSLLIAKSNAPFHDIPSLHGATLALTDPKSTSGAVVPRYDFPKSSGQSLESFFGKIVYAGDHFHAAQAVLNKEVDVAFVASSNLSDLVRDGKVRAEDFRVIWRSQPLPLDPFVYRKQLCAPLRNKLIEVFLKDGLKDNKTFFNKFHSKYFIPASDADYRIVRELL